MKTWIVVPEGLAKSGGLTLSKPSFAYQAVLDWVLQHARAEDQVYLAPANCFGGSYAEDEVAAIYLKAANASFAVKHVEMLARRKYIDTYGNALCLGQVFPPESVGEVTLICGKYHQLRSYFCFRAVGYKISQVIGVPYDASGRSKQIVGRLFFYHYPLLHIGYEILAIIRDGTKIVLKAVQCCAMSMMTKIKKPHR